MTLHNGISDYIKDPPDNLGGLDRCKQFSRELLASRDKPPREASGLLILGEPGAGKISASDMRKAMKIVDAMMPVVLCADEIEKTLSGELAAPEGDLEENLE